ncbi:hypothetical protein [Lewinella sp. W8]|uniref:hypothetical protein n=1 Tax=Lewinella sp. W8 TaxID=2528208 RepID=UPI001068B8B5|nr:hypothetical protein [Lewinella sp. W8]MTB50253.1 hypothetical protein [Lewinella sp. W8]
MLILEETGERLSVSTLKRTWGRTTGDNQPSVTTLNILAQFVGYDHWRTVPLEEEEAPTKRQIIGLSRIPLLLGGGIIFCLIIGVLLGSGFGVSEIPKPDIDPDQIEFSVSKVAYGIPNTVVFRYDLGGQQVDTLELQQSWDDSRRKVLSITDSLVTATYLSPGYFNAKLIADGRVVKRYNLYLPSEGFQVYALADGQDEFYRLPGEYWHIDDNRFDFSPSYFAYREEASVVYTELLNLLPSPPVSRDTFSFMARIKLSKARVESPCHGIGIAIVGSEDVYRFQSGQLGCSGYFSMYLGGEVVNGETEDLSYLAFPADVWVDISIQKRGKQLVVNYHDQRRTLSHELPDIGKIGGVRLYTQDHISLRVLRFEDSSGIVDLLKRSRAVR